MAHKTVFILLTVALVMGLIGGSASVAQVENDMYYACVNLKGASRFVSGCNKCYTNMSERCYVWEGGENDDWFYNVNEPGNVSGCLSFSAPVVEVTAYCDEGDTVTGGGYTVAEPGALNVQILSSNVITGSSQGWAVRATKTTVCANPVGIAVTAICDDTAERE